MIVTEAFLTRWKNLQTPSIIVYGPNSSFIHTLVSTDEFTKVTDNSIPYAKSKSWYVFDILRCKKKSALLDLLRELCTGTDYYSDQAKKTIVIINLDKVNRIYQHQLKTLINVSYQTCVFLLHTNTLYSLDAVFRQQFIALTLPPSDTIDTTIGITYRKIMTLLEKPLSTVSMQKIRDIAYYYYMNHTDSQELQRFIVCRIGEGSLPQSVKMNVFEDICKINTLYQHSYRKPIFLEYIIVSMCKHMNYNL